MIQAQKMKREFSFGSIKLPDPGPAFTPDQVRSFYAAGYPDITSATLTGPEVVGNTQVYYFAKAVGIKG